MFFTKIHEERRFQNLNSPKIAEMPTDDSFGHRGPMVQSSCIKKSTGELDWRILENKNFEILLDFTGFLLSSTGFYS